MARYLLTMWSCAVIFSPCISNRSRTGIRRPPSCCARAFATAPRSKNAPLPICQIGRPNSSRGCARCSRAAPRRRPTGRASSCDAPCRTVMSPLCSARCAPSGLIAFSVRPATAASSLGDILGLGAVDEDELYAAIDWLGERQGAIEQALARKHLRDGTLVLYDVSSSYLEGRCCELARLGYNRDGKKGKLQIVYGLMCAPDGCPVAIEVFEGDTGDPATL